MRNVSGASLRSNYQGTYSAFMLRGLMANNDTSYLRDGYRMTHLTEPMLFNLERIEVIKGPNAIDFGQSMPGGFVNYVTKKPLEETQRSTSVSLGSDELRKGSVDLGGPLAEDKSLLYRLTAGYEKGGDFTDHVDPERKGVAGALSWRPTADTRLNLSAEHNEIAHPANPGLPVPDPAKLSSADALPVSNYYGESTAVYESKQNYYAAELVQALSDQWSVRGLELEASGRPLPGLDVMAQATFLDPEVIADGNASRVGKQLSRSVRNTWSLWAKYRLPGELAAWQVGGGVFHNGAMMVDAANTLKIPAYTVADAFVSWQANKTLLFALNVHNLADKRYYIDAGGSNGSFDSATPGRPRSVVLTTDMKF